MVYNCFCFPDPNVRTACLTCIGAMVGIRPPLMEVSQLIRPPVPPVGVNRSAHPGDSPLFRPEDAAFLLYPSFSMPQVSKVTEEREEPVTEDGGLLINSTKPSQGEGPMSQGEELDPKRQADASEEATGCAAPKGANVLKSDITSDEDRNKVRNSKEETDSIGDANLPPIIGQDGNSGTQHAGIVSNSEAAMPESTNKIINQLSSVQIIGEETSDTESGIHSRSGVASSAEGRTPALAASSGEATPIYKDQTLQSMARETSWVIKFSVKNIIGRRSQFVPLFLVLVCCNGVNNFALENLYEILAPILKYIGWSQKTYESHTKIRMMN